MKKPGHPAHIGVMDLGAESLELVTARNMRINGRTSIPIGSGWLHDRFLLSDPPTSDEIAVADAFLQTYFEGLRLKHRPPILLVTGESANALLYLVQQAFQLEEHHTHLTQHDLIRCQGLLSSLTAEELAQRYHPPIGRPCILLATALIIQTVMSRLHITEIHISSHGMREGTLPAYGPYSERWLEIVSNSASLNGTHDAEVSVAITPEEEPFAQSGRRKLKERTHKMLELPNEVLKHEDVEAVHRMRVASRRLRATLDAYQAICDPKRFKAVYRQVKQAADALGAARDTDVMLLNLHAQLEQVRSEEKDSVKWIIERLHTFRQQRQRELESFLHKFDEDMLKKQIALLILEGGTSHAKARRITGLDPEAPTGKNARVIAKVRLEELYSWESSVDHPYHIRELHNMRIAAKRLRYTFEVFEEVFPVAYKPLHQELVQIQDELGALHDTDVMIALLRLCLGSWDTATALEATQLNGNKQHPKKKSLVSLELVEHLLDPAVAPSAEERYGLELFLQKQEHVRTEQYDAFRQHWYALQAQDFKRRVLELLETEAVRTQQQERQALT